jgi:hypothetical protein
MARTLDEILANEDPEVVSKAGKLAGEYMISNRYKLNSSFKPITHLDLEEKIMAAWHTVDDLKVFYNNVEEMDLDQLYGAIDGLRIFADMRQQELWDTFEAMLHNERLDKQAKENLSQTIEGSRYEETGQGYQVLP